MVFFRFPHSMTLSIMILYYGNPCCARCALPSSAPIKFVHWRVSILNSLPVSLKGVSCSSTVASRVILRRKIVQQCRRYLYFAHPVIHSVLWYIFNCEALCKHSLCNGPARVHYISSNVSQNLRTTPRRGIQQRFHEYHLMPTILTLCCHSRSPHLLPFQKCS